MQKRVFLIIIVLLLIFIKVNANIDTDENNFEENISYHNLSNVPTQVNLGIRDDYAKVQVFLPGTKFSKEFNASSEEEALNILLDHTNLTLDDLNKAEIYRLNIEHRNGTGELFIRINRTYTEVYVNIPKIARDRFNLTTINREEVMNEIFNRTNLTLENINNLKLFKLRIRRQFDNNVVTPPNSGGGGGGDLGSSGGSSWSPTPEPIVLTPVLFAYPDCHSDSDCKENEICTYTFHGFYKQCIPQKSETIPVLLAPSTDNAQTSLLTGLTILNNVNKNLWAGIIVGIIVLLLILSGYLYLNKK